VSLGGEEQNRPKPGEFEEKKKHMLAFSQKLGTFRRKKRKNLNETNRGRKGGLMKKTPILASWKGPRPSLTGFPTGKDDNLARRIWGRGCDRGGYWQNMFLMPLFRFWGT